MGWGCLFVGCSVALFVFGLDAVAYPLFLLGGLVLWETRKQVA